MQQARDGMTEMLLRCSLSVLVTCTLAGASCQSSQAAREEMGREAAFVTAALSAAAGSKVAVDGPERAFLTLTWTFRLRTMQSAPHFCDAVITSLAPRYKCRQEPNQVGCSRALSGDLIQLEIVALPGADGTAVRTKLKAMAD
jgi:hypothetical protein